MPKPPDSKGLKAAKTGVPGYYVFVIVGVAGAFCLLACGCGVVLWFGPKIFNMASWQQAAADKQPTDPGSAKPTPPPDPAITPPDKRGAPPWQPLPAKTDFDAGDPLQLPGVVGYWALDDGKGTALADKTGKNPAGKIVGGWWIGGVRGKAVLFDGKADYINLGEAAKLDVGDGEPFSLSVWVATKEKSGAIVLLRHSANGAPLIAVFILGDTLTAQVRADRPESGEATVKGPGLSDGRWHHIAVTRNRTGLITLYLDGVKCGQASGDNSKGPITTNLRVLGSERYLVLQGMGFNAALHYLNGAVDEFAFFSRELTDDEIKRLAGKR